MCSHSLLLSRVWDEWMCDFRRVIPHLKIWTESSWLDQYSLIHQMISISRVWIYNDLLITISSVTRCEQKGLNQYCNCLDMIWFVLKYMIRGLCWEWRRAYMSECMYMCLLKITIVPSAIKASQHPTAFQPIKHHWFLVSVHVCVCARVFACHCLFFFFISVWSSGALSRTGQDQWWQFLSCPQGK